MDEWGQALWPFSPNSYKTETVFLPPDLSPVLVSNPVSVEVTSAPAISDVEPAIFPAGTAFTLTVNGINFVSGATIELNGSALTPTTFVSATQLTVPVGSTDAGQYGVTVSTSGTTSNAVSVTAVSGLGIVSVSPALYQAGTVPSDTLTVTVTGFGFASGALVAWNGAPVNTEVVSETTLIAASRPATSLRREQRG